MKHILLVCSAGMSTSLLVNKMKEAAMEMGKEADIWAVGDAASADELPKADIVLLGPQVRYLKKKMEARVNGRIPVEVIDMKDYGSMNGKAVLEKTLAILE